MTRAFFILFLIAGLSPLNSIATQIPLLSVPDLTEKADFIAVAKVLDVQPRAEWTYVTIQIEKTLKGKPASQFHFRIPGGKQIVNGRTLVTEVEGAPVLSIGERGVFFLAGKIPEYFRLVALSQGYKKIHIANGKEFVKITDSNETLLLIDFVRAIESNRNKKRNQ